MTERDEPNELLVSDTPEDGLVIEPLRPGQSIEIDWQRAEEVLGILLARLEENGFPYNNPDVRLAQDPRNMPSEEVLPLGTKEHAMFMWTICYYMRGMIRSNDAVRMLSKMYENHPDLFVCEVAQDTDPEVIANVLQDHGLGVLRREIAKYWVQNARMMQDLYGGDARNIFEGVTTYEEALARIQNKGSGKNRRGFYGFQEKMVSMITYYLMDAGLIDEFNFPVPVDLHVLRISVANELVKFTGYEIGDNVLSDELLALLRQLYETYAREHNINPRRLADAVWLMSNALCRQTPGNVTFEPEGRKNRKGRSTVLVPQVVDFNDPGQQRAYERSCRECPIQTTCKYNIGSAAYYVSGELRIRSERAIFPEPAQLSLLSLAEVRRPTKTM